MKDFRCHHFGKKNACWNSKNLFDSLAAGEKLLHSTPHVSIITRFDYHKILTLKCESSLKLINSVQIMDEILIFADETVKLDYVFKRYDHNFNLTSGCKGNTKRKRNSK